MDYGKYRFEQAKREKEAKKNQKVMDIKEVRLSLNIDVGDFNTKANHARRFLSDGNKVKVSIRFRGREMAHAENGNGIMDRFAEACAEVGTVEKPAKLEGRSMLMFLVPKTTK
jgi:translation initiation factor IF-3